ncbi:4'-phosphopantetheinyl transferase family protein [Amycolatopsis nigrescens]|uniref:4'-phosphopantetheinyl transferase family protein n=1 Tax=Amycolatopsis nigrescens TaxID=381445 RepID=UPI00035C17EB|nr:hypothetical protein [Amycolatopsis nigrescens]
MEVAEGVWLWTAEAGERPAPLDLLDDRERTRAMRYHGGKRESFVLVHGLRRLLLAERTGVEPERFAFTADDTGYPNPVEHGEDRWFHSLSHSGPFVAVAVAANRRLGVDIERPREIRHRAELAAMLRADGGDADILTAWVRWEALAKATGQGLARRLHPVPDRLTAAGRDWRVRSLPHQRAYLALVVSEGRALSS